MESETEEPELATGNVEESSSGSDAYSPGSQENEPETGDEGPAREDNDVGPAANSNGQGAPRPSSTRRQKDGQTKARLSPAYCELLNETILQVAACETAGTLSPKDGLPVLPSSQIFGSHWTPREKARLFATLPRCGPEHLPALARAVGSKSEVEIKAYLSLLQQGVEEAEASGKVSERFEVWDVEAAVEVGEETVQGEEAVAGKLGKLIGRAEAKRDEGLGEWAIVGEEEAERLDGMAEGSGEGGDAGEANGNGVVDGAKLDNYTHDTEAQTPPDQVPDPIPAALPMPAAALLRPSAFLALSQNLLMNSADPDSNWQYLLDPTATQLGPAIHNTALQDLHNLIVNLTRRIVQATIFQALSRLRATTDPRTVPGISGADVRAAVDVLGLKRDGREFWARVARRCGVEVWSEAKRFKDGRVTGKTGVKLEYHEVEAELGFPPLEGKGEEDEGEEVMREDVEELERDEDLFTETDGSEGSANDDDAGGEAARHSKKAKRKRALSPHAYDKAEDDYLDRLDRLASIREENRLREILDLDPLPELDDAEPENQFKRARREERRREWRDVVAYRAPWETVGFVGEEEFEGMEGRGRRGRLGRERIREVVRKKLRGDREGEGDDGDKSEDGNRESGVDAEMEDYESEGEGEAEDEAGMKAKPEPEPEPGKEDSEAYESEY